MHGSISTGYAVPPARAPWPAVSRARRRASGRRFGLPRSKPIIRARSTKACGFNGAQILGGERIGVPSPRRRHGRWVGNSLLWRPSAWNSDWKAQEALGAHRESNGGERSVREGLEGAARHRRRLEREREGAVRGNPSKTNPKSRRGGTYGCVGSWRISRAHRRRGLRHG